MKQKIKLEIAIVISIMLIIVGIIILTVLNKKSGNDANNVNTASNENIIIYDNETEDPEPDEENIYIPEISFKEYFDVKGCVNTWLSALNSNNSIYYSYDENGEMSDKPDSNLQKNNVYNLLYKAYSSKKKINEENVLQVIDTLNERKMVISLSIAKKKVDNTNMGVYEVKALVSSTEDMSKNAEENLIVYIDYENSTFAISPEKIKLDVPQKIEKNDNNIIGNTIIKEENIVREYGMQYKYTLLSDINRAYNLLNEDYKKKRFPKIEDFKKYVEKNKDVLQSMNIEKYELKRNGSEYQYYCLDQYENVYVFTDKGTFEYDVILDYYTVDILQFAEKYEAAKPEEKVAFNINKCIDAINNSDYGYMYSKLDETFKKNNYPTQEKFEEEMKKILFEKNTATDATCTEEDENLYSCETIIVNEKDKSKTKEITFIMQLGEGTDFVMSFSVE